MVYGLFDIKPGSCGKPVPGYDVQIFDPDGHSMPPGHLGDVVIKLPVRDSMRYNLVLANYIRTAASRMSRDAVPK
jgi:acyl-coenzyme A synthetase/AMP-(fatty) acid ligase